MQPALDKFYGLLNDEQKARLNALAEDQRRKTDGAAQVVAQAATSRSRPPCNGRPSEIEARLHPTDAQRAGLTALQDASAKAADMLKPHLPDRRRGHAAGAARRRRQAARHHAAGGQARCARRSTISMRR